MNRPLLFTTRGALRWLPGIALGLATAYGQPAAVQAQQLWKIEEVAAQSVPPIVMNGVARNAAAGAPIAEAAAVQVALAYLRLGMGYLELPLPDGTVIEARNAVFEDRGDGNLMWTGEVQGAGYESVLFTLQDGHLVGWFGTSGGPNYIVHAAPDGRGRLAVEAGASGDWCDVRTAPNDNPRPGLPVEANGSKIDKHMTQPSHGSERLDILLLYTDETVRYWRSIGGAIPGVQHASDVLNMVFRNGRIPVAANLIPVHWKLPELYAPPPYHRAQAGFGVFIFTNPDAASLGRRHRADLVHYLPAYGGGSAQQMVTMEPAVRYGFSNAICMLCAFVHEIGHNLGGHHDPPNAPPPSSLVRPYAFGHTDLTSCSDTGACPATIMSYGTEASRDDDPSTYASIVPFFSSVRHKPNGWTIGIAGERENERVFHQTAHVAVRNSENPDPRQQSPQRVSARWTGPDKARVSWSEPVGSGVRVRTTLAEGGTDVYGLKAADVGGVDIEGLRPGGDYRIAVNSGGLDSNGFRLRPPAARSGSPAAPTNLQVHETGPSSVRLTWADNSHNEAGFTIYYRDWVPNGNSRWLRWGRALPADTRSADVRGLTASEQRPLTLRESVRFGRYSFVVVAHNDAGFQASETLDFEFMPDRNREPTVSGEVPRCWDRPTGLLLDGYEVRACFEEPDGDIRRTWNYRLESDESGLLYFFDRDNAEVLVKVLDGCKINGHRWVFVAPVTTLGFRLTIREFTVGGLRSWYYDSERRPQDSLLSQAGLFGVGNPKGRTARTVSDTTAFPCMAAEIRGATAGRSEADGSSVPSPGEAPQAAPSPVDYRRLSAGSRTDCEPGGPALTLRGGYTVSMCYETYDGLVGDARDWGLASSQSALLYFFQRNNAEVLIKVLDGCGVNGHRWVFVAPVTDLAFNLRVESPDGEVWTHTNHLGQTADAASDTSAFPCAASS